jgi:hypothetical protein
MKFRSALIRIQREALARLAAKLPTRLLDDARIAMTDELARRGYHLIPRSRPQARKKSMLGRH